MIQPYDRLFIGRFCFVKLKKEQGNLLFFMNIDL